MKCISAVILFLFTSFGIFAQEDSSFRLIRKMKGDIIEFTVDNLNNVYTLSSRNQVKKYNANGDHTDQYFKRGYGKMYLMR